MCIIKKVFCYEETKLPIIKYKDDTWFRGKTIAEILKYTNQCKAICDHVDPEDRVRFNELHGGNELFHLKMIPGSKGNKTFPVATNEKNKIYVNEPGLYSLILCSKLESAHVFK